MPPAARPTRTEQQRAVFDTFVATGNTEDRTDVEQVLECRPPGKAPCYVRQVIKLNRGTRALSAETELTTHPFDATRRPDFAPGLWERLLSSSEHLQVRTVGIYQLVRMM